MAGKRYFFFKLNEHFHNEPILRILFSERGSYSAIVLYLRLIFITLKTNGILSFGNCQPQNTSTLALLTFMPRLKVWYAFRKLTRLGLVKRLEDGSIALPEAAVNICSETYAAARMRKMRSRMSSQAENQPDEERYRALHTAYGSVTIDTDTEPDINTEQEQESESAKAGWPSRPCDQK